MCKQRADQERCLLRAGALPRGSEQLRMCRNVCAVSKPRTPSGTVSAQAFRLGERPRLPFLSRFGGKDSPRCTRCGHRGARPQPEARKQHGPHPQLSK